MKKILVVLLSLLILSNLTPICAKSDFMNLKPTEIDNIYVDQQDNYYYKGQEGEFFPVTKTELSFDDSRFIEKLADLKDYGEKVIDDIYKDYLNYQKDKNYCSPDIVVMATASTSSTGSTYTYNGHSMRKVWTTTNNLSTGIKDVARGSTTISKAKTIASLVMMGVNNTYVNLLSNGITLYEAFCNYFSLSTSAVIATASTDYCVGRLQYNKTVQYTQHYEVSMWEIGLVSYNITVTNVFEETYFANSGCGVCTKNYNTSKNMKSTHYDSPDSIAINYTTDTAQYEYVNWKCNGYTWRFV